MAKIFSGKVLKKTPKTCSVVVRALARGKKSKMYGKQIFRTQKYLVHDGEDSCREGDVVSFKASAPLSKRKRWTIESVRKVESVGGE